MATDSPSKSDSHEEPYDFAALLRELAPDDRRLPDPAKDPSGAFRRLYDGWIERGGYVKGKPRHSVRQIKIWLGRRNEVRSLETKLAGKTLLQRADAARLLGLFLERWTYSSDDGSYQPLAASDPKVLMDRLLSDIYSDDRSALLLPLRSRSRLLDAELVQVETPWSDATRPSSDVIAELFAESDALITVSRARTIIGTDPADAMAGFQRLMDDLFTIDRADEHRRALIWIVDIGLREDSAPALQATLNLQSLANQFRALALINTPDRQACWEWLSNHVIVLVGSLKRNEIDLCYADAGLEIPDTFPDQPWFMADRIFLESVPGGWLDHPGLEAFGRRQRDLWHDPTITAHLRLEDWDLDHPREVDPQRNMRYFFHGSVEPSTFDREKQGARCVELVQPGQRWSGGFRLACSAAFGRLGWLERVGPVDAPEAIAQLRRQHFAVFRLREFRRFIDLVIDHHQD